MLSEAERRRVEDAVREAERGTAGEIVVVLARRAGSYRSVTLLYGLLGALLTPLPLIFLTDWPAVRIFAAQLGVTLLCLLGAAAFGVAAAPPALRRARARTAARREFASRGMADTRGRTGVLLFVALRERYAEVLGDVTIAARVPDQDWREVIEALLPAMQEGRGAEALVSAIGRIGSILARHVPPGSEDHDELPNRVVMM